MALLAVVLSVSAPSLARFFRGRSLDSEALRLLALTRYAQSRAVSEGVPMALWIDEQNGRYGLQVEHTYTNRAEDEDDRAVEYNVDEKLTLELAPVTGVNPILQTNLLEARTQERINAVLIRFSPEGFQSELSPEWICLREKPDQPQPASLWVAQSENGLNYELRTNQPLFRVRR